MKTIMMLFSILVLSLVSAIASAEGMVYSEDYFAYEEVPVLDAGPTRTEYEDFMLLYEGIPIYEEDLSEEVELSVFEEMQE